MKQSITVPNKTKSDKTDCSNLSGTSLLPTTHKILSTFLLSNLTQYAGKIIGDHQCGFRRNRSTSEHILCVREILEKMGINEAVYLLFTDFKKAYDSGKNDVLYNNLIDFVIPMIPVRLITMCLPEMYKSVRVVKNLCDIFHIKNGLKQGDVLLPFPFYYALENAIRRVQVI